MNSGRRKDEKKSFKPRHPHGQTTLHSNSSNNRPPYNHEDNDDDLLVVSRIDEPNSFSSPHRHHSHQSSSRYTADDRRELRRTPSPAIMDPYRYDDRPERDLPAADRRGWRADDEHYASSSQHRSSYRPTSNDDSYYSRADDYYRTSEQPNGSSRYYSDSDQWSTREEHTTRRSPVDTADREWRDRSPRRQSNDNSTYERWPRDDRYSRPTDNGWASRQDSRYDDRYPDTYARSNGTSYPSGHRVTGEPWSRDPVQRGWGGRQRSREKPVDDRAWQPAATWQDSSREDKGYSKTKSKKGKNKGSKKKDKSGGRNRREKEWRDDDEYGRVQQPRTYDEPERSSTKRRRASMSRSRSPSTYRSTSPASPTRRKRRRTGSPTGYGSRRSDYSPEPDRRGRTRSRTPASSEISRQRPESSPSVKRRPPSVSSRSHSRSSSRSTVPAAKPAIVHRLDAPIRLPPAGPKAGSEVTQDLSQCAAMLTSNSTSVRIVPTAPRQIQSALDAQLDPRLPKGPRIGPGLNGKFGLPPKPVVASNSIKHFFPGDEDDADNDVKEEAQIPARGPPPDRVLDAPKGPSYASRISNKFVAGGIHEKLVAYDQQQDHDKNTVSAKEGHRNAQNGRRSPPPMLEASPVQELSTSVSKDRPPTSTTVDDEDAILNVTVLPETAQHEQPITTAGPTVDRRGHEDRRHIDASSRTRTASAATLVPHPPSQPSKPPGESYHTLNQVGEGTFGKVYKAQNTSTGALVALKRIRMEQEKDGFPVTAMREIKLLQSLRHPNVVRLYEMMVSNGSVYMVFEYMDHDLTGVLNQSLFTFSAANLKSFCSQMLMGLSYLHHKGIIHRDMKGSNILLNNQGELKLADFGLARFYHKRRRMDYTNRVITLWYRPPELVLGATDYGPEVDMWSAGCIMVELFTKKPLFAGNDEIHQLDCIYTIMGTPTVEEWPALPDLPWFEMIKPKEHCTSQFRKKYGGQMTLAGLDLAQALLTYDPVKRVTAVDALQHPYFMTEEPAAAQPIGMFGVEGEWHEFESKREREREKSKNKHRKKEAPPANASA